MHFMQCWHILGTTGISWQTVHTSRFIKESAMLCLIYRKVWLFKWVLHCIFSNLLVELSLRLQLRHSFFEWLSSEPIGSVATPSSLQK